MVQCDDYSKWLSAKLMQLLWGFASANVAKSATAMSRFALAAIPVCSQKGRAFQASSPKNFSGPSSIGRPFFCE
jgi:hypothetical protein